MSGKSARENRVLLIEDHFITQTALCTHMEKSGYTLIQLLDTQNFCIENHLGVDLVLLDHELPSTKLFPASEIANTFRASGIAVFGISKDQEQEYVDRIIGKDVQGIVCAVRAYFEQRICLRK